MINIDTVLLMVKGRAERCWGLGAESQDDVLKGSFGPQDGEEAVEGLRSAL